MKHLLTILALSLVCVGYASAQGGGGSSTSGGSLLGFTSGNIVGDVAADAAVDVRATVFRTLTAGVVGALDFGYLQQGNNQATIAPSSGATISVTGDENATVSVASNMDWGGATSPPAFTANISGTGTGGDLVLDGSGAGSLDVGGTLDVNGVAPDDYDGTLTVTLTYTSL